jgi:hypothetical protein
VSEPIGTILRVEAIVTSLVDVFDFASARCLERIEGMSDAEYLWAPAPGYWTITEASPGVWTLDGGDVTTDPPPLTTIAWRTCHIGGHVLGGFANWLCDGGPPMQGDPEIPPDAARALAFLDRNCRRWRDGMTAFPEDRLWDAIGPQFGPFSEASAVDLILHVLDEFLHHGAEIGLLRDLDARLGTKA